MPQMFNDTRITAKHPITLMLVLCNILKIFLSEDGSRLQAKRGVCCLCSVIMEKVLVHFCGFTRMYISQLRK